MLRRPSRFAAGLGGITALALVIRLGYILVFRQDQLPFLGDALIYSVGADLLASGEGFIRPFSNIAGNPEPSAAHPPLYIIWLAVRSLMEGGHASQLSFLVWSSFLGSATVVVCGLAGREIVGERVGLIAAGLAAVYPNIWVWDGMLLGETMAMFMVAVVILFAYRFLDRPSWPRAIALGAGCGFATLSRSELILTLPLIVLPMIVAVRSLEWRARLLRVGVALLAAVVVLAPWLTYNARRFDEPVYLSTNFGGTLAAANCEGTYFGDRIGFKDYECGHEAFVEASRRNPDWDTFDASQQDKAVRAVVNEYVQANGTRFAVVVAARVGRVAGLYRPFQEVRIDQLLLGQEIWVGYSVVWSFWILAALAIAGGVRLRRQKIPLWPLVAIVAIVVLAVATTFGQLRYRAPAEVALVLLAAPALEWLWLRSRRRYRQPESSESDDLDTAPEVPVLAG